MLHWRHCLNTSLLSYTIEYWQPIEHNNIQYVLPAPWTTLDLQKELFTFYSGITLHKMNIHIKHFVLVRLMRASYGVF